MTEQTDAEFKEKLRAYLGRFSQGHKPIVPLSKNADGTINREKTLALPCYQNFTESPQATGHG